MVKNTIKQLINLNNILIPFIEGLAKITEVDAKLALKADATAIPDVSDFITETKAEVAKIPEETITSGSTLTPPNENLKIGQQYFDTTLGVPVSGTVLNGIIHSLRLLL